MKISITFPNVIYYARKNLNFFISFQINSIIKNIRNSMFQFLLFGKRPSSCLAVLCFGNQNYKHAAIFSEFINLFHIQQSLLIYRKTKSDVIQLENQAFHEGLRKYAVCRIQACHSVFLLNLITRKPRGLNNNISFWFFTFFSFGGTYS